MKKITLSSIVLLAVIFITGLSSCAKPGAKSSVNKAKVSFVHASKNTGTLDFYLDGTKENSSPIAYQGATGYTVIASGSHTIMATIDATSASLIDTTVNLAGNTPYSVFVLDTAPNISALILNDSLAAPPSGMANIRIVNAVPNSPAFNIAISGGGTTLATNLSFKGNGGYVAVTPGSIAIQVSLTAGGTVTTFPAINFASGKGYTLCITGIYGQGLSPLVIENF